MDPISNFLNKLKMASKTGKESFTFPSSKFICSIAEALEKKGFILSCKKNKKGLLEIKLPNGEKARKVTAVKRVSKLSKRIYRKASKIRTVQSGFGSAVISTPKGVLLDSEARLAKVGGEILFEIW